MASQMQFATYYVKLDVLCTHDIAYAWINDDLPSDRR